MDALDIMDEKRIVVVFYLRILSVLPTNIAIHAGYIHVHGWECTRHVNCSALQGRGAAGLQPTHSPTKTEI
jgi:hypothetical protein